jgi:hypothetical protein
MKQFLLSALVCYSCYSCNGPDSAFVRVVHPPDNSVKQIEKRPDSAFNEREQVFFNSLRKVHEIDTVFALNSVSHFDRSLHRVVYHKDISMYVHPTKKDISSEDLTEICRGYYEQVLADTVNFNYVSVWYDCDSFATGISYFPGNDLTRSKYFNPKRKGE